MPLAAEHLSARRNHSPLWWVPAGHTPTITEAVAKLELLRAKGASPEAFHFGESFSAPDAERMGGPSA